MIAMFALRECELAGPAAIHRHSAPRRRSGMISRVRRIGVFALFALLVAGCTSSGDPGGTFTPTSTYTPPTYSTTAPPSSPSVATSGPNVRPGEKPPVLPAVGRTNTAAGARAFAVFYIEALDWGYATMDSTLAKSLYATSCKGCARFVKNFFDAERRSDRHYVGSRAYVTGAESLRNDHQDGADQVVDVTVRQQKGALVDAAGRIVSREPAVPRAVFRGWLVWRHKGWVVANWKRVIFK